MIWKCIPSPNIIWCQRDSKKQGSFPISPSSFFYEASISHHFLLSDTTSFLKKTKEGGIK